jgi:hypothetical protein
MRYASFNAQILVDESEQTKPVDELIEEANGLMQVPVMTFNDEIQLDALDEGDGPPASKQASLLPPED